MESVHLEVVGSGARACSPQQIESASCVGTFEPRRRLQLLRAASPRSGGVGRSFANNFELHAGGIPQGFTLNSPRWNRGDAASRWTRPRQGSKSVERRFNPFRGWLCRAVFLLVSPGAVRIWLLRSPSASRDWSPVAAHEAHRHRGSLQPPSSAPRAASRDGSRSGSQPFPSPAVLFTEADGTNHPTSPRPRVRHCQAPPAA